MQRKETPVRELPAVINDGSEFEHFRYRISGVFDTQHQILLDNQIYQGQAGYHVITPLKVSSIETRVLVNRGWIPWGDSRETLPVIETPEGDVEIIGRAVLPPDDYFSLESSDDHNAEWQTLWQNLDMEKVQTLLPFPVYPIVIQLNADVGAGFVREWVAYDDYWIQRHRAYAFHWFSFAVLLLAIWAVYIVRARRAKKI